MRTKAGEVYAFKSLKVGDFFTFTFVTSVVRKKTSDTTAWSYDLNCVANEEKSLELDCTKITKRQALKKMKENVKNGAWDKYALDYFMQSEMTKPVVIKPSIQVKLKDKETGKVITADASEVADQICRLADEYVNRNNIILTQEEIDEAKEFDQEIRDGMPDGGSSGHVDYPCTVYNINATDEQMN